MKVVKSISLFFVLPVLLLGTGFLSGILFMNYFYPGSREEYAAPEEISWQRVSDRVPHEEGKAYEAEVEEPDRTDGCGEAEAASEDSREASFLAERLNADTTYVLEETDLRNATTVETVRKLPAKYIGLDRDGFVEAMESYEASPPLAELERGFVSLEVLRFSASEVAVRMNYEYTQPTDSFYLAVENHFVVVYLDDRETVYMHTDLVLWDLPQDIQQEIIYMMYVPDEESLYDFLETYSS